MFVILFGTVPDVEFELMRFVAGLLLLLYLANKTLLFVLFKDCGLLASSELVASGE